MILVTGASGFIGLHLTRHLASAGHHVRALVRSAEGADLAEEHGAVEVVRSDIRDPELVAKAAAGCGVVYHLAGSHRGGAAELRSVHIDGTANLCRALGQQARLIQVSSTSVFGWSGPWPATEASQALPASAYGHAKLAAERVALDLHRDVVVVRPTIVYGPGDRDGMLPRVRRLLRAGFRFFPGDGSNRIHLLHVDDLCRALLSAAKSGSGTFVLCGPEPVTMRALLRTAAEAIGTKPPVFLGAERPAMAVAAALEWVWGRAGRTTEPPLTRHSINVAVRDRCFRSDRAHVELGWSPRVDTLEGVAAAIGSVASTASVTPGPEWRRYLDDPDEGLGTVYERFALTGVLETALDRTGARSVLQAPLFGMTGIPGLELVELARAGVRVGLADVDEERLHAVVGLWHRLGLDPEAYLLPRDPAAWPEQITADRFDLTFSFAALWWFEDFEHVLAAQARWARTGVLACVPNPTAFMRLRARTWHRRMFERLHLAALDVGGLRRLAGGQGLRVDDSGLFDIPPFPDTAVPLAHLFRRSDGQAWRWSILPYLEGAQPELPARIARLTVLERSAPQILRRMLAHHRYLLLRR